MSDLTEHAALEPQHWAVEALKRIYNKQTGFRTLQDARYYIKDELIKGGCWDKEDK